MDQDYTETTAYRLGTATAMLMELSRLLHAILARHPLERHDASWAPRSLAHVDAWLAQEKARGEAIVQSLGSAP